ncbi:hypothetical protein HDU83_005217 [Entophlyctis luteolus]|nr:hypothetical protein HDU82_004292 [Entophlyctis luteolus]KAJ3344462.1 hypothetical protein HDU83_005217 [Entophlyctis luteolus]
MADVFGSIAHILSGASTSDTNSSVSIPSNVTDLAHDITANEGILGGLTLAIGLYLMVLGYKLFKPTVFIMGFAVGSIIGYAVLVHFRPPGGYPSDNNVIMYGSGAIGLICGALVLCLIKLTFAIIGAAGGLVLALFILGFQSFGIIQTGTNRAIFISVMCAVGAIGAFLLQKHVLILATSFVGAYSTCFGVDCFAHTGFVQASEDFLSSGNAGEFAAQFQINTQVVALSAAVAVLFVLATLVQYRISRGRDARAHWGGGR